MGLYKSRANSDIVEDISRMIQVPRARGCMTSVASGAVVGKYDMLHHRGLSTQQIGASLIFL